MAIRNRQGQGQGHPEGSEEGTPTTPQTKGENQRAANAGEALGYTGNKCSTRMGTARGWTQAGWSEGQAGCAGCQELHLQDMVSKDPSPAH